MKQEVKYKKIYNFGFFVSIQIIIVRIQENIIIDIHLSELDSPLPQLDTVSNQLYIHTVYM